MTVAQFRRHRGWQWLETAPREDVTKALLGETKEHIERFLDCTITLHPQTLQRVPYSRVLTVPGTAHPIYLVFKPDPADIPHFKQSPNKPRW